jgi:hypothetical protein
VTVNRRDALLAGAALLAAPSVARAGVSAGRPIPFGYKIAWFAVRSPSAHDVVAALDLVAVRPAGWEAGMKAVYADDGAESRGVFVTPAVRGWVFAVGWGTLMGERRPNEDLQRFMVPTRRLIALSRRFGKAQFYSTHRVVEAHAWARAAGGRLERAYAYVGDHDDVALDVGKRSAAERGVDLRNPTEEVPHRIAGICSIDPMLLDGYADSTGPGFFGTRLGAA